MQIVTRAQTDCASFQDHGLHVSMCQLWQVKLAEELASGWGRGRGCRLLREEFVESLVLRLKSLSGRKERGQVAGGRSCRIPLLSLVLS